MKKGIGPIAILLLGLFGTVIVGGITFVALYSRTTVTKRAMAEINIIDAINRFELSRIGLSKALEYSFYESCYLTSPMGGYYKIDNSVDSYDCIPYWRDYDYTTKYPGFDYTGKLMLEALKDYVEEIDIEVDIPEYEYFEVEMLDDSSVRIQVSSGEKLSLGRDKATVESDTLETTLTTNIGKMYKIANGNFIENDIIQEKIQEAINKVSVPKTISVGDICENELDADNILGINAGDWESDIRNEVEEKINELSDELTNDEVEVDIEILEVSVSYEPECSHDEVVEDEPSCCKESYSVDCGGVSKPELECNGINYCNPYFVSLATQNIYNGCYCDDEIFDPVDQVELCEGCEEYYDYLKDVTCTYNYYASARILVEITDDSNQVYPVMDADHDVEFKPIVLNLYVLSGNDYDQKVDKVTDNEECEVELLDLPGDEKPPGDASLPPYIPPSNLCGKTIVEIAEEAMGHPYLINPPEWDVGLPPPEDSVPTDCSSLTKWAVNTYIKEYEQPDYQNHPMYIEDPDSYNQGIKEGRVVDGNPTKGQYSSTDYYDLNLNKLIPGDLIFFAKEYASYRMGHVGLYAGDGDIVHARGSGSTTGVVKENLVNYIDEIGNSEDNHGIYVGAKRVCPEVSGELIWPVPIDQMVRISACYGSYPSGGVHYGVDMSVVPGTEIYAAASGVVVEVVNRGSSNPDYNHGFGNAVRIEHTRGDGSKFRTFYGHFKCSGVEVVEGQSVDQGQLLGYSGGNDACEGKSTGGHLHFQLGYPYTAEDTEDPCPYFVDGSPCDSDTPCQVT